MSTRAAAVAALQGLSLGDAFGETWFHRPIEDLDVALDERRLKAGPWPWTDDTAMALSVVRVLDRYGCVDQDALAMAFAESYATDPDRWYGPSMHRVLMAIGQRESWAVVTRRQFGGLGSWGNGAAMRVAPLGAWFADNLDVVISEAARSAVVTHAHPEAVAGAVAVAFAAALNTLGALGTGGIGEVADRIADGEVAAGLRRAASIAPTADPRHVAAMLGSGYRISAADTVPYAIWCAARHPDDLVEALWTTASGGGDVDTTCAIVGGIVGCRVGLERVPATWLEAREPLPSWVASIDIDR